MSESIPSIQREVAACRACPRLVKWREKVAREKRDAYRDETYWGRGVPCFGDPRARLLVVGLAPAAHGANRTGRLFTGDRSGDWLYRALHKAGFANQPEATGLDDGLVLKDAMISDVVRCAPPENKPTPAEIDRCLPFLTRELAVMPRVRVIICLGSLAWKGQLRALADNGHAAKPAPRFAHGAQARVGPYLLIGSYHPSQRNTFTGRLTEVMFDAIFRAAKEEIDGRQT